MFHRDRFPSPASSGCFHGGRILLAALGLVLILAASGASAQTVYADPAGRFSFDIPKNWSVISRAGGRVTIGTRSSSAAVTFRDDASADIVLSRLLDETARSWTRVAVTERSVVTAAGATGSVVIGTGVNPRSVPSIFRIAVVPLQGGILSIESAVPKEHYGLTRLALENLEESVMAGVPVSPARTEPAVDRDAAEMEEAMRAGIVSREQAGTNETASQAAAPPPPAAKGKAVLGVRARDLSETEGLRLGLERGAVVAAVVPEGPAHRAGLLAGDIVTRLDGIPIPDASALVHAVSRRKPGETAVLEIRRGEETTRIRIELGG